MYSRTKNIRNRWRRIRTICGLFFLARLRLVLQSLLYGCFYSIHIHATTTTPRHGKIRQLSAHHDWSHHSTTSGTAKSTQPTHHHIRIHTRIYNPFVKTTYRSSSTTTLRNIELIATFLCSKSGLAETCIVTRHIT